MVATILNIYGSDLRMHYRYTSIPNNADYQFIVATHPSASDWRSEFAHCDLVPDNSDRCTCDKTQQRIREHTHIKLICQPESACRARAEAHFSIGHAISSREYAFPNIYAPESRFGPYAPSSAYWSIIFSMDNWFTISVYQLGITSSSVNANSTSCYSRCVLVSLWGRPIDPIAVASSSIITIGTHNGVFACFLMPLSNVSMCICDSGRMLNVGDLKLFFLIEKRKVVFTWTLKMFNH